MTPAPHLHPLRCETCDNNIKPLVKCKLEPYGDYVNGEVAYRNIPLRVLEWNSRHGCASHSASSDVLEELDKKCYDQISFLSGAGSSERIAYKQVRLWIAELRSQQTKER